MKVKFNNHYAPRRWTLGYVLHKITNIGKIVVNEKDKKKKHILACQRELEAIKKHIIFFHHILERYEKEQ